MPDLEAIGDAATGAVLARTVEPDAGRATAIRTRRTASIAAAQLAGDYCHACGQRAHVHRTLQRVLARPAARRAPFRRQDLAHAATSRVAAGRADAALHRRRAGQVRLANGVIPVLRVPDVRGLRASAAGFRRGSIRTRRRRCGRARCQRTSGLRSCSASGMLAVRAGDVRPVNHRRTDCRPSRKIWRSCGAFRPERFGTDREDPDQRHRTGCRKPIEKAAKNPDLLFYKLKTNAYKFSWMLIPLSVPFLWLLFPFSRRFRLYDHTVFVTYSLGFMTLLVVTAVLIGLSGLPQIAGFAMLIPPFHIYRQLKGTYGLSRWGALVRTCLLVAFSIVALGLFFLRCCLRPLRLAAAGVLLLAGAAASRP